MRNFSKTKKRKKRQQQSEITIIKTWGEKIIFKIANNKDYQRTEQTIKTYHITWSNELTLRQYQLARRGKIRTANKNGTSKINFIFFRVIYSFQICQMQKWNKMKSGAKTSKYNFMSL